MGGEEAETDAEEEAEEEEVEGDVVEEEKEESEEDGSTGGGGAERDSEEEISISASSESCGSCGRDSVTLSMGEEEEQEGVGSLQVSGGERLGSNSVSTVGFKNSH